MITEIWLFISLIIVILLSYKPVKAFIQNFLDTKINETQGLLKEAEKTYQDAQLYLSKVEKDFKMQLQINKKVLEQTKNQLAELRLQSEKETTLEVKRQLEMAEARKKIDEEIIKKEITSIILTKSIQKIIAKLDISKDANYINYSLNKLDTLHIKEKDELHN